MGKWYRDESILTSYQSFQTWDITKGPFTRGFWHCGIVLISSLFYSHHYPDSLKSQSYLAVTYCLACSTYLINSCVGGSCMHAWIKNQWWQPINWFSPSSPGLPTCSTGPLRRINCRKQKWKMILIQGMKSTGRVEGVGFRRPLALLSSRTLI